MDFLTTYAGFMVAVGEFSSLGILSLGAWLVFDHIVAESNAARKQVIASGTKSD